jgi:hypothetical protein
MSGLSPGTMMEESRLCLGTTCRKVVERARGFCIDDAFKDFAASSFLRTVLHPLCPQRKYAECPALFREG